MTVRPEPGPKPVSGLVHIGVRDVAEDVVQVEVGRAATRPYVDVRVRDLVPLDEQPDPVGVELFALGQPDEAGDPEDVSGDVGIQVDPLVDLRARHDHRVPELKGTDRQERDTDVIGPDEPTGDLAVDDACEQGGHGPNVTTGCDDGVMTRYVALLRGVNVGGVRITMADLRGAVEGLGHADVATYVQSGNVTFTADGDPVALGRELEVAVADGCQVTTTVIVLSAAEWDELVVNNPYPEQTEGTKLHAVVASQRYTPDQVSAATELRDAVRDAGSADDLTVVGRVLYLHLPDGMGRSKLAEKLGRSRAAGQREATARNWRTVLALQERLRG